MAGRSVWDVLGQLVVIVTVCGAVASAAAAGLAEGAEPPTAQQLMDGAPVFWTADPQCQAVTFQFEMGNDSSRVGGRISWNRERRLGFVIWTGAAQTPFLFISDGQTFLLDRSKMKAVVGSGYIWSLGCERNGDKFNYTFGGTTNPESDTGCKFDFRSFIRNPADQLVVQRDADGDWLLIGTRSDGQGTWRAEFLDVPGYPLHRFESNEGGQRFILSDIAVNERVDTVWPAMPEPSEFPDSVRVRRLIWPRLGSVNQFVAQWWRIYKAGWAVFAVENPAVRSRWIFGFADWDRIAQRNAEVAPALRKLFVPGEP
ncbi:MAG: hypothetical protein U0795_04145 [Pirellulales bacterium]